MLSFISHVEVEFAIRAENKGVDPMVVVLAANAGKQEFTFIRLPIAVGISQDEDVWRIGDDYSIAQHTDAQGCVDARILVKDHLLHIASRGAVENNDPVAGRLLDTPFLKGGPVIDPFSDP